MYGVGRNEPCPCGSGKKFKKCCLGKAQSVPLGSALGEKTFMESLGMPNPATQFLNEFKSKFGDMAFENMEDAQRVLSQFSMEKNNAARMDFLGLSSEHVHTFARSRLGPQQPYVALHIPDGDMTCGSTPIMCVALAILDHIAKADPLKSTAQGNLPRKVVQEISERVVGKIARWVPPRPQGEQEVPDLFRIRCVMEAAKIIVHRRGAFHLTGEGRAILEQHVANGSVGPLYRALLLAFVDRYNWPFDTNFDEKVGVLQDQAVFGLYILHKKARTPQPCKALFAHLRRAFPMMEIEMGKHHRRGPEGAVGELMLAFDHLFLDQLGIWFGLVRRVQPQGDLRQEDWQDTPYETTDLFRRIFQWKV